MIFVTVNDILEYLDSRFPLSLACEFDNSGLLIGNKDAIITKGVVALDCTDSCIEFAKQIGANLIVAHHPIMFGGINKVLADSTEYKLISNNISLIAMHTNLDLAEGGLNDELCKVLGLKNVKIHPCDDFAIRLGELECEMAPCDFAKYVGERLNHPAIKYVAGKNNVKTVGLCSGSGGEFLTDAIKNGADAYVSGDIKHHLFVEAENKRFTLLDAGHSETEIIAVDLLKKTLDACKTEFLVFKEKSIKYT